MIFKQEYKRAYALAGVLLIVGLFSYVAFSAPTPEEPFRIMFKGTAGKVLFDHQTHTADTGYGLSCEDCHHTLEDDDEEYTCTGCHEPDLEEEDVPNQIDAFHLQCIGCHEQFDAGPIECETCHAMKS